MEDALSWIVSGAAILLTFAEFSKIKINPWSALFGWIGRAINKDLKKEIVDLRKELKCQSDQLNDLTTIVDMNEIKRIRAEIFDFADSLRVGIKHTKDNFDHILDIHNDYAELLQKHGMTNGRMDFEYNYILEVYEECKRKDVLL